MTDLPEISDEMVDAFNRASGKVWKERAPKTQGDAVAVDREATRAGLAAALVASGWRPEADVLREAAEKLRSAAAGRREYAEPIRDVVALADAVAFLDQEADTIEAAARVVEGDIQPLYNWLPSRWWSDEMVAKLHGDRATALEQAQPLPVADGSPFGAVVHEQTGLKGTSKAGQEHSEEQRHG